MTDNVYRSADQIERDSIPYDPSNPNNISMPAWYTPELADLLMNAAVPFDASKALLTANAFEKNNPGWWKAGIDLLGNDWVAFNLEMVAQNFKETAIAGEFIKRFGPEAYSTMQRIIGGGGPGSGGPSKAQQIAAAEAMIRNEAQTLGYTTFGEDQIKALAKTVIAGNWSSDQVTDYLVTGATSDWSVLSGGALTGAVEAIKAYASQQLVAVSDETAQQWARRIASGELDQDGLRSLVLMQAKGRYTWASEVLDQGITMMDYLAPSRDRIAQELEVNAADLNLSDSKTMKLMTVKDDKGGYRLATDAELVQAARQDGRWKSTNNARELASSAAMMLRQYVEGR